MKKRKMIRPSNVGMYYPQYEKDNCGVGMIANITQKASHKLLNDALSMLSRMDHRGGCGYESNTGDGAGVLSNIPNDFFIPLIKDIFEVDVVANQYAVGMIFLPQDSKLKDKCIENIERIIKQQNQILIGWRNVPTQDKSADIGSSALMSKPNIKQVFIKSNTNNQQLFERDLYVIRKYATNCIHNNIVDIKTSTFYFCSLSSKTIVYKGMLIGSQLQKFYTDLQDKNYNPYFSMVHSRFSTNTFPSWDRAHPYRVMSHNGEINTRQGNFKWMEVREKILKSKLFDNLEKILPVIEKDMSDSGGFDNVLEFLMINGYSLKEAILFMVPEAWHSDKNMPNYKKSFYKYYSALIECWDGPASIIFTNGDCIGGILDRNGLRGLRYYTTYDDTVVMASEVGVVDIPVENIKHKSYLKPGEIFFIDFTLKKIIQDKELKNEIANKYPYEKWLLNNTVNLLDLVNTKTPAPNISKDKITTLMKISGWSRENLKFKLLPLIKELRDPVGSMGNDEALACLSDKPRLLFDYFKQLFAQVTNPAIDSIREEVVMSLAYYIGPEGNLLNTCADNVKRLWIEHPILLENELVAIKDINTNNWHSTIIDITYDKYDSNLKKTYRKIV